MSNNIEQIQAIQAQQTEARKKVASPSSGFESMLSSQLSEKANVSAGSNAQLSAKMTMAPDLAGNIAFQSNLIGNDLDNADKVKLGAMAAGVDQVLNGFENYASRLASGGTGSLKTAHSLLQDLSQSVKTLRIDTEGLSTKNPSMESILNELDVIATTERFKFNRGDYI